MIANIIIMFYDGYNQSMKAVIMLMPLLQPWNIVSNTQQSIF